jgi:hypothetical protein
MPFSWKILPSSTVVITWSTSRTTPAPPSVVNHVRSASPCLRTQGMTLQDTTSSGATPALEAK